MSLEDLDESSHEINIKVQDQTKEEKKDDHSIKDVHPIVAVLSYLIGIILLFSSFDLLFETGLSKPIWIGLLSLLP